MKKITALGAALLVTGCSTIINGSSQEIIVNTNPPGAACVLEREGMPIAQISSTPSGVVVKKTKHDIKIVCNKKGYQETTYFNRSGSEGATWGNIVAGGGIGWAIDSASGSDNKYESPVNLTMPKN